MMTLFTSWNLRRASSESARTVIVLGSKVTPSTCCKLVRACCTSAVTLTFIVLSSMVTLFTSWNFRRASSESARTVIVLGSN